MQSLSQQLRSNVKYRIHLLRIISLSHRAPEKNMQSRLCYILSRGDIHDALIETYQYMIFYARNYKAYLSAPDEEKQIKAYPK